MCIRDSTTPHHHTHTHTPSHTPHHTNTVYENSVDVDGTGLRVWALIGQGKLYIALGQQHFKTI
eukprot:8240885-Alexandrium_andersonii.AAC.1